MKKSKKQRPKLSKPSKGRQHKKKIIVQVQDYGEDSNETDEDPDVQDEQSVEEEYYHFRRPTSKPRGRYYVHRPYRNYHRDRKHYKARSSVIRKKLIWDRKFQNEQYAGNEEDSTSSEEDNFEDTPVHDEYQDHFRKRFTNWRTTGVDLQNRPDFNQDLSERLDRNYGAFFGTNSPSTQGVHHRNVPRDYFSREQLDDQFERRMDFVSDSDLSVGRSFGEDAPELDFQKIPKKISNTTADTVDRIVDNRRNGKEKAVFEMPGRYRRVYSKWSKWSKCSAKCVTKRLK